MTSERATPQSFLPFFAAGSGIDPGPSFTELLRAASPDQLPWPVQDPTSGQSTGRSLGQMQAGSLQDIVHATTVVAIRCVGGVVMAGDRRATEGHAIASRRIDKVHPGDRYCGVAIAGAAGPAMEMVRLFQTELEHYEKVEGESLSLEGKANKLSQMVRANLPAAMQGLAVVPLFAGFDRALSHGRIFKYDVTGGRYEEVDFHATGSGGVHAKNWIKANWSADLSVDDAVAIGLLALFQAADEDSATGGPDLIRGIYPSVAVIDSDGFRALSEEDIQTRSTSLLRGDAQ